MRRTSILHASRLPRASRHSISHANAADHDVYSLVQMGQVGRSVGVSVSTVCLDFRDEGGEFFG
jgi:hypothetical protein